MQKLRIPRENNGNNQNHKIRCETNENHKINEISVENYIKSKQITELNLIITKILIFLYSF